MPGKPDLVHHPARDVQRPRPLAEQDPRLDRVAGGHDGRRSARAGAAASSGGRLAEEFRLRLSQVGRKGYAAARIKLS